MLFRSIAALKDKDEYVRKAAAYALGKIKDPRAVEPLIAALKDHNSDVREAAAYALGKIKDPRAVEPLIAALKDEDSDVRKAAAEALGEIKDPRAVEPLIAALKDESSSVRRAAAEALGKIGDPRAVEPLIAALKDKDSDVRYAAAKALGEIKDPRAVEPLIAVPKDYYSGVRYAVTEALVKIGAPAMEPLIAALKDKDSKDSDVRQAAAEALGEIKDPRAVEPLIAALGDESSGVRLAAAKSLGEIKDPRAVEPLSAALKDENKYVRRAAAHALDRLGWKPEQDEIAGWYWMAKCDWDKCVALGALTVEPLIAALKDTDEEVRRAAAEALGKIKDRRAVEPLSAAFKDTDKDVRQAAAVSLDRLGWKPEQDEIAGWYWMAKGDWDKCVALGSFAVEPLIAALKDTDEEVRRAAAEALDRLGWKPEQDESAGWYWMAKRYWGQCVVLGALAVEPLIAALKHKDSDARKVAAEALGEIKDPRAVEPLIAALKDEKWDVRAAAAEALVSLYRNASLSETAKQTILAYRSKITSPHTDDDNWGSCSGHTDSGIGVYFPL